ncbi:MAG: hypothetical protein M0Q38_06690 [Bacteroidales bacterium]|nr:hypothetical protein [Bacteroidales bacterium]
MRDEGRGTKDEGRGTRDEGRGMLDNCRVLYIIKSFFYFLVVYFCENS